MIQDKQLEFCSSQLIVATASSTNTIDLGGRGNWGPGSTPEQKVDIPITIDESFNNLTSLTIAIRSSPNSNMSSPTVHQSTTFLLAQLTAGARLPIFSFPQEANRYVDILFTVAGTAPTTGKITARGTAEAQVNR